MVLDALAAVITLLDILLRAGQFKLSEIREDTITKNPIFLWSRLIFVRFPFHSLISVTNEISFGHVLNN
ncbi:unnamed protein product [Caenorhabditis brenneri]